MLNHHTPAVPAGPVPAPVESAQTPIRPSAHVDPADDHRTFLWRVKATDLSGRERVVHAGLRDGHMVLIVPAGESATLTAGQARKLASALWTGADQLDNEERAAAQVAGRPVPMVEREPAPMVPANSGGELGFSTDAGRREIGRQLPGYPLPHEGE